MAARIRVHIRMGEVELPTRQIGDGDITHDVIDIDIGDNEEIYQLDLEPTGKMPRSTGAHAGKQIGPVLAGSGQFSHKVFRYRAATVEKLSDTVEGQYNESAWIEEAEEVAGELPNGREQ